MYYPSKLFPHINIALKLLRDRKGKNHAIWGAMERDFLGGIYQVSTLLVVAVHMCIVVLPSSYCEMKDEKSPNMGVYGNGFFRGSF